MHHLSTTPRLLQPPLSLRMPCPEGIRQRRPWREKGMRRTSVCLGLGGASLLYLLVTPWGYQGGPSRQS